MATTSTAVCCSAALGASRLQGQRFLGRMVVAQKVKPAWRGAVHRLQQQPARSMDFLLTSLATPLCSPSALRVPVCSRSRLWLSATRWAIAQQGQRPRRLPTVHGLARTHASTPFVCPPHPLRLQLPSDVKLNYFDAENNMQEVTVGSLTKGKKVRN